MSELQGTLKEQEIALRSSATLYIGNLSYYTREEQVSSFGVFLVVKFESELSNYLILFLEKTCLLS